MRIEQLQYIIEVARTGSFTLAAEKLHISQPNISYSISLFEKEIGAILFTRTRSGTKTTEVGKQIIDQAHEVMALITDMRETAQRHTTLIQEKLMIGAISGICTSFLPKALSSFSNKYPNVELDVIEDHSGEIEEGVLQGTLDLGLVGIPGEYDFKHLNAHKFLECKILACVGTSSPFASKKSVSLYDIVKYPIIGTSEYMRKEFMKYGEPKEMFNSSRSEAAKRVTSEGLATSFYLDISLRIDPYVSSGQMIPIPIEEEPSINLYWLHPKKVQSAASSAFIKELLLQASHFQRWKSF
ncbi:LysR family transcriptional regulator [Cohnella yongneupensis]|uniref:LysR family transcriptional regulator n=1 Tax=Cohnella yongneupensis TaxID=425006 RepID=A0ABW0R1Z7_9BACL